MNIKLVVTVEVEQDRITNKDKDKIRKRYQDISETSGNEALSQRKASMLLRRGKLRGCRVVEIRDAEHLEVLL